MMPVAKLVSDSCMETLSVVGAITSNVVLALDHCSDCVDVLFIWHRLLHMTLESSITLCGG